ncbi:MAG: class I SAM-dependent methyltransferase [bacterium]|nr:class I SAM-dependent methyltransferase [bacterium]MBU1918969.1 class I SAM-dependent methyltransferase [bacterium]
MLTKKDLNFITCLHCENPLSFYGTEKKAFLYQGVVVCKNCDKHWPVKNGLLYYYNENKVQGTDRMMRVLYNTFAKLHDPAVKYLLPLMHYRTETAFRKDFFKELKLEDLFKSKKKKFRILEVSIGAGANLDYILPHVPKAKELEYWGIDLSTGMVATCEKNIKKKGYKNIKYFLADAHFLPFKDNCFDRVFHIGAIGGFNDPKKSIKEMIRVAKTGTPIVISDEALHDPKNRNLYEKAMFKFLTFYDRNPHAPTECVPENCAHLKVKPISNFYYCMSFKKSA